MKYLKPYNQEYKYLIWRYSMDVVTLSRWQFGLTTIYHFFFVPLTLGLSVLVAVFETLYVCKKDDRYKKLTKFWGTLFVINFAMGVVTGIVQEFQFGMNWSEYSRFVGDIFGAPLAIEALLAFFLESTFLGLWIFGWERVSKGVHLAAIWLIAAASTLSAFWILSANSFMQHPVAYSLLEDGKIVMSNFFDLVKNPYLWVQFPHVLFSGFTTAAFFVMGISAYHLIRKREVDVFNLSFRLAAVFGLVSTLGVVLAGHQQTQRVIQLQPMKLSAAEGLWRTEDPASFSIFTLVNQKEQRDIVSLRMPYALSILAYNKPSGAVQGVLDLQQQYETLYGAGNYIPSITLNYWTFRIMVGVGFLLLLAAFLAVLRMIRKREIGTMKILKVFPYLLILPYVSNTTGWMLTEMGRQPWVVFGLLKTTDAYSPNLTPGMVWTSLILFVVVYGVLMIADIYLLKKYAQKGAGTDDLAVNEMKA